MNRLTLFIPLLLLITGCTETVFKEHEEITKYANSTYSVKLAQEKVKFLKCYPNKEGEMVVVYTTNARDNSFPATIRFDYLNKAYNVYFDESYFNKPKEILIKDIDTCMANWEKLKDSKQTWR
jgi:hypothetical protein